jgi:hypothetical protein
MGLMDLHAFGKCTSVTCYEEKADDIGNLLLELIWLKHQRIRLRMFFAVRFVEKKRKMDAINKHVNVYVHIHANVTSFSHFSMCFFNRSAIASFMRDVFETPSS